MKTFKILLMMIISLTLPVICFSQVILYHDTVPQNQCDSFTNYMGLDIPINIIQYPQHGNVNNDTGLNYLLYCPDTGFTGLDSLLIDICPSGPCDTIKLLLYVQQQCNLSVNVLPNSNTCPGGGVHFNASAAGGTPPYTYQWSNGVNVSGVCLEGDYGKLCVTVTDNSGCSATSCTNSNNCTFVVSGGFNPYSCGGEPGIAIFPYLGTAPYYYLWGNNDTTNTICNPVAGSVYCARIFDSQGCQVSFCDTVPACTISVVLIHDSACSGGQHYTGNVTEGVPPFSYFWSDGTINSNDCQLNGQALCVTVGDAAGCYAETCVSNCPTSALILLQPNICNGQHGLTVSVTGGNGPFHYSWSTGDTGITLCNLSAADSEYCVNISNDSGCSFWTCTTLPLPMIENIQVTENQCDTFFGNPYTGYNLDSLHITTFPLHGNVSIDSSFTHFSYCPSQGFTGQDSMICYACIELNGVIEGCDTFKVYFIVQSVCNMSVALIADSACVSGEHYTARLAGGTTPYTYLWSDNSEGTADCMEVGGYGLCVTVTDSKGCVADTCNPGCPTSASFTYNAATCNGQPGITVTVSGGPGPFYYNWSNGDTGVTACVGNTGSIYCVSVGNHYGCSAVPVEFCDTIPDTGAIQVVNEVVPENGCSYQSFGTAIQYVITITIPPLHGIAVSEDSFFRYCPDTNFVGTDSMRIYFCQYYNGIYFNCSYYEYYFTVQRECNLTVTLISDSGSCPGGQHFTASVSNGVSPFNYLWNDGSIDSGICRVYPAQIYCVTVTDANGCTATGCIPSGCSLSVIISADSIACNGEPGIKAGPVSGTPPYTYFWNNGNSSVGGDSATLCGGNGGQLASGVYCVDVVDANSCFAMNCYTINGPGNCSFQYAQPNADNQNIDFYGSYDTSYTVANVYWNFGDQTGGYLINPVHNYASSGSYYVTMMLYYTSGDSCSYGQYIYVYSDSNNIYPQCQANFTYSISKDTVYFTDLSVYNATSWQWNFGDGISSFLQNPTHVFVSQGNWNVCLTVTTSDSLNGNTACSSSYCQTVSNNSVQDMQAYLFHGSTVTPGYPIFIYLEYYNNGNILMNGTAAYRYPEGTALSYAYPAPVSIDSANRLLTFSYDSLLPGSSSYIGVSLVADSNLSLASLVYDTMWVYPMTGDASPSDNISTITDSVVGSWDPNGKSVSPKGRGEIGLIEASTPSVSYIIHFQNTGNAPARQVVVRDTMSDNIDMATVRVTYASFPNVARVIGNVLLVSFENINLPDTGTSLIASQGYISVIVNLKPGLAGGTRIYNTANIFFDVNAPVITNTVVNTIPGKAAGINSIENLQFTLIPNPASGEVLIKGEFEPGSSYTLDDLLGRQLLIAGMSLTGAELNVGELSAGIYLVKVTSNGKTGTQRLVVVR